jgi:hypothetical protein
MSVNRCLPQTDAGSGLRILRLTDRGSLDFAAFTFPAFRCYLGGGQRAPMVYVGAIAGSHGNPVAAGLAMAILGEGGFELLSLNAGQDDIDCQTQEVLLIELMAQCAALGYPNGVFLAGYEHLETALPAMLSRRGWQGPRVDQLSIISTVNLMLRLPFLLAHGEIKAASKVIPWHEVDQPLRVDLAARLKSVPAAVRDQIDPFANEAKAWPALSFALVRNDQIMGWHLPEFFDLDVVRWTVSVAMPGHNSMVTVFQLWLHALRAQRRLGMSKLIFGCHAIHPHMVQFMLRRLPPAATSLRIHSTFVYQQTA